jgi:hypothetical protein
MSETENTETETEEEFVVEENTNDTPPSQEMDEELSSYSEKVRARIEREVAARRMAERQRDEVAGEMTRVIGAAKRIHEENEALKRRASDSDGAILDSIVQNLKSELEIAKEDFRKAHEEGDASKIADATASISSLAADLRRAEVAKAARPAKAEVPVQPGPNPPPAQNQPRPQAAPKALAWIDRNKDRYGKDQAFTVAARAADAYVAALGLDPNSDEYYSEVDKMISARLNGGNGAQPRNPRVPSTGVTPVGRTGPASSSQQKVSLSPDEQGVARRLGLTNAQYAEAKAKGTAL